eukprot:731854-Alexandrium_andersonii.AAC.1
MSASLVGSEMCIRDRRRPTRGHARARGFPEDAHMVASACLWTPQKSPVPCLLYTSDAADDM